MSPFLHSIYPCAVGAYQPPFLQSQVLMSCCTGDAIDLAAALARQPQTGGAGVVRPPAIVVEYMGQGSLKGALYRKADIVQGALIRVLIAMDAAKVGLLAVLLCVTQAWGACLSKS